MGKVEPRKAGKLDFLHQQFSSSSHAFRILHTWMLTSSLHCLRVSRCRTFTLGTTYKGEANSWKIMLFNLFLLISETNRL